MCGLTTKLLPVVLIFPGLALADRRLTRPIVPHPASRVSLDVLVHGRPLRKIVHRGTTYLPVKRMGDEYTLRVRNNERHRVEVCIAVDGISIMNRRPFSSSTRGYVVPARSEVVLRGWRQSDRQVSTFCFTDRDNSLANRRHQPQRIGLITMTVHHEQRLVVPRPTGRHEFGGLRSSRYERGRTSGADRAGLKDASRRELARQSHRSKPGRSARGDIGTGQGRDLRDPVDFTTFNRTGSSHSVRLTYNLASKLAEAGILAYRVR